MSSSSSLRAQSVIVTRLRAVGCVFAEDEARLLISAAPHLLTSPAWWTGEQLACLWKSSSAGSSFAVCGSL